MRRATARAQALFRVGPPREGRRDREHASAGHAACSCSCYVTSTRTGCAIACRVITSVTCASATVAACLFFPQTLFPALGNALDVTLSIIVSVSATLWKAYMYVFTNVGPVATLTLACSAGAALTICVQVLSRHGMFIVLSRAARFAGDLLWALARSVNRRQSGTQKSEPELCAICLEGEGSVRCTAETHSVCIECFNRYAREWITNGDPRLRQEREGRLVCPCHLPEAGACEGIFDTQSLALHLSSTDFQTYDEHRRDEMRRVEARKLHADFVGSVRGMANRLKQSAPVQSCLLDSFVTPSQVHACAVAVATGLSNTTHALV